MGPAVTIDSMDFMNEFINGLFIAINFMMTFSFTTLSLFWFYFVLTGQTFLALKEIWTLLYRLNVTNYDE